MNLLIDTHAHLCDSQYDTDRSEALKRAYENGVRTIVEIGENPLHWDKAKVFASEDRQEGVDIYWSCGFHPHYAEQASTFDFDTMKLAAASHRCVAVGEVGLDYFKSTASKEEQISLFRKSLEVSAELNRPVILHCREAQADMGRILRSFYGGTARADICPGVIHCFSGDRSFAELALELGFCLGVDGPITYPNANPLREVIRSVPLEKIVLETDSPYLPPQGWRGKRNEPAHVASIAEKLAEMFGVELKTVAEKTSQNVRRLFRMGTAPYSD